jgi:hypothetical protein
MQMLKLKNDEILGMLRIKYPGLGIRMVQGRLVKERHFSQHSAPPKKDSNSKYQFF